MMVTRRYRILAIVTCIGMLLVLLGGALVTNTGSGEGCGTDWPLCHGKFIPAKSLESLIEYSHRFLTGVEGLLVVATLLATLIGYRKHREPIIYAAAAFVLTVVQALMGRAAVIWPTSAPVMALHFGISMLAVAATLLLVIWTGRARRGVHTTTLTVPRSVFPFVLATTVYCYVVVYIGAFLRHTDSAGGCVGWPLCNGEVIPELEGATLFVFIHRVAAMIFGLAIVALYLHIRRVSGSGGVDMKRPAGWVLTLVVAQILSGAWLTATIGNEEWFIFTNLLHNVIITGLFGLLIDMTIRAKRLQEGRRHG
ncbi:heme A synthase [Paenibacillus sp. GCM10023252]|uniref:COX15/CtaA family protein n=1 Tax=Paenibacillus sp. GCM10023252 TaxID=3252649 RepID=UPI00360CFED2